MQQFTAITGLLIAIVSVILGAVVLASGYKRPLNFSFGLVGFSLAVWGASYFLFFAINGLDSTGIAKLFMVGALFIPPTYLGFVLAFTERTKAFRTLLTFCYAFSLFLSLITVFSTKIVAGVHVNRWFSGWPTAGAYYPYFLIFFFLVLTLSIWLLSHKQGNKSGDRQQTKYLIVGAVIGLMGGATNYPLWYGVELPPVGNILVIAFPISITYAILKTRLFDIKLLLTEIAVVAMLILSTIQTIALSGGRLLAGILLTVTLFVGGLILIRSVRDEVSRREEIEKLAQERTVALKALEERNKNLATLQKISDVVLNESDIKPMTQKILDELPKQLDNCAGAFLTVVRDGNLMAFAFSQNSITRKISSIVGADLEQYSHPIQAGFNTLHDVLIEKTIKDSDNFADFISPPLSKSVARTLQTLVGAKHIEALPLYAGGEPFGVMMYVFTRPREEIHEQSLEIMKAIAGDMSLAIQRAQAFQKLKAANEYLAELDKMKDEFISMASHELNTPLAAIEGYLSMILDENMGQVDAKSREYLNRAYASSKRLADLILDLLNVSRIEQGRLKMRFAETNLVELAESVVNELQIKADAKKLTFKIEGDKKKIPAIWCDPDRIREVFVNLAGNALKFTEKGSITLKVELGPENTIIGSVTDTGRGIAEEDQKKLFQKFSQVKREVDEHQGTGLGLYISKNFVELHNGRISVKSQPGKGSTFTFELPILKEAPKQVSGAMLETPTAAPKIEIDKGQAPVVPKTT